MTAKILNGNVLATHIRKNLTKEIHARMAEGFPRPSLAVILVGSDPASMVYVKHKRKDCQDVGITSIAYDLPKDVPENELLALIDHLNQDAEVSGILVQLPLPAHINSEIILDRILPEKDVDGFHPYNLGRLAQRRPALRPCTPYGIMQLLEEAHIEVAGMNAVIVGASNIVGRPMALELLIAKATVTVCHRFTQNLAEHVHRADLLVVATGNRGVVSSEWIKPGAIVIDVGIHRLDDQTLTGDLDFPSACAKASYITPVPGGVGPMTRAALLQNTLLAAKNQFLSVS